VCVDDRGCKEAAKEESTKRPRKQPSNNERKQKRAKSKGKQRRPPVILLFSFPPSPLIHTDTRPIMDPSFSHRAPPAPTFGWTRSTAALTSCLTRYRASVPEPSRMVAGRTPPSLACCTWTPSQRPRRQSHASSRRPGTSSPRGRCSGTPKASLIRGPNFYEAGVDKERKREGKGGWG